jgi:K+-transporting ATPase ATPase A chain
MNDTAAGWLQFGLLFAALAACYVPLGNYIAKIYTADKHWRIERGIYKTIGIDPSADQKWSSYIKSVLAFSAISVLFLYGMQRLQGVLLGWVGPHFPASRPTRPLTPPPRSPPTRTGRTTAARTP